MEDAADGKAAAKAELRRRMSLGAADVPLNPKPYTFLPCAGTTAWRTRRTARRRPRRSCGGA